MRGRSIRSADRRARFLASLESTGHVLRSAAMAGASVRSFYNWREEDPEFAADWEAALERAVDRLEDEAFRRALQGVEVPVYYHGEPVGIVYKFSDPLLMFLLTRLRPRKYGYSAEKLLEFQGYKAVGDMSDDEVNGEIRQLTAQPAPAGAAARAGAAAGDAED